MAEYILDVMSQTSKLDWAFPFQRTGAFPIDRSLLFSSLADAQAYAVGDGSDERALGGTSYVGQIISVYEAGEGEDAVASANAYIITPARGLMKLAATTASGDVVADIADLQGKVNQLISDLNAAEAALEKKAEQSYVVEELGKKADTETVNAALDLKANLEDMEEALGNKADAGDVDEALALKADKSYVDEELNKKANAADVYAKTETYTKSEVESYVQGQIGSAGHLKREIVDSLPEVASADVDTIYMVKKTGGLVEQDHYEEYMVINGAWEQIGDTFVDLTNYATKEYVDGEIETVEGAIALKADQSALDTANENIAKKADTETVNAALELKADKTQVATDIANAIAPLAVKTEVEGALAQKADKATTLEGYGITDAYTQTEVDNKLADKANSADVYTQTAADEKFAAKATTLAGYGITDAYTKEEVDAELLKKASQESHNELVDVVNGKADKATTLAGYGITDAYTAEEADAKIAEVIGVKPTQNTDGDYVGATGIYTDIYTKDEITDLIADITGGESAADVLAALNAYKTSTDPRIKALEDVGAQANVIESVSTPDGALAITDKNVTIPTAMSDKLGLVKSTDAENGVAVAEDGTMSVNSVNVNKLVQSENDWLILNGGTAAI